MNTALEMHDSYNNRYNSAWLNRVPTQMTEANFSTFQHYKSQEIMTYSRSVMVC